MEEGKSAAQRYSAFISHASADADKARTIAESLEEKGLRCWIAPRDLRPGAEYPEEIMRGISESNCLVLVLSDAANMSNHVRREVERAAAKGKAIFPVRIEEVMPSPKLEYFVAMHHWLDAWDGILSDHAARLAAAIQSDESWIDNRTIRRRRIRSGGIAGLGAALLVAAAFIFGPDVRSLLSSEEERARQDLADLGVPFDATGLGRAIAAADEEKLALFEAGRIDINAVANAFADSETALGFMAASKSRPGAVEWLAKVIDRGFNPNLPIKGQAFEQEGMLRSSLRASNLPVALALVKGGASPHIYQDLWLTRFSVPMSVFPYSYIKDIPGFSDADRVALVKEFISAGAVIAGDKDFADRLAGPRDGGAMKEASQYVRDTLGLELPAPSSICEADFARRCEVESKRSGFDWCAMVKALPYRVTSETDYYEYQTIQLVQFVNVMNDRAIFLATLPAGYYPGYGRVEISRDGRHWTAYKFTSPGAGMGLCKKVDDYVPDDCWRMVELTQSGEAGKLRLNDYYDYEKAFCPG